MTIEEWRALPAADKAALWTKDDRAALDDYHGTFTGGIFCRLHPVLAPAWHRLHKSLESCIRISAAEAFDALGPWGMMRELAKGREILCRERLRRIGPFPWTEDELALARRAA